MQLTLREELEIVYKAKGQLEEENNNFKMSMMSNRGEGNDQNNMAEMHAQLEKLKEQVQIL